MKRIVACLSVLGVLAGVTAAETNTVSRPVLAGTMTIAPFGEVAQKVSHLGVMINNPIVPMLVLTPIQQYLTTGYGAFRMDSPIYVLGYIQTPAWDIAATNAELTAVSDLFDKVIVYPAVEGLARMALNHPGSTRSPDGTLHLLPNEDRPEDLYVRFASEGGYCAFAESPALAEQALKDVAGQIAARKKTQTGRKDPLVHLQMTKRGMTALVALGQEQASAMKKLEVGKTSGPLAQLERLDVSLDLDESGLVLTSHLFGAPTLAQTLGLEFTLPDGVLNLVPDKAPLFLFGGNRLCLNSADEKAFRAEQARHVAVIKAIGREKTGKGEKADLFKTDTMNALAKTVSALSYPGDQDWFGAWLAFDGANRPFLGQVEQSVHAAQRYKVFLTLCGEVAAAATRQWPDQRVWTCDQTGRGCLDVMALLDLCGQVSGVKPSDKEYAELETAKKRVAAVLGAPRLELRTQQNAERVLTFIQADKAPAPTPSVPPTGEKRARAALPEIAQTRPSAVVYFSLYEAVRENVLPMLMKMASEKDRAGYKTMLAALAPAGENCAVAGAVWAHGKGGVRSLLRVTANEMKNLGAAFNAFTAATVSASMTEANEDDE